MANGAPPPVPGSAPGKTGMSPWPTVLSTSWSQCRQNQSARSRPATIVVTHHVARNGQSSSAAWSPAGSSETATRPLRRPAIDRSTNTPWRSGIR